MKRYEVVTAVFGFVVLSLFFIAGPAAGSIWKLSSNHPNVKVYTRPVQDSSYLELQGVTSVQTSISAVVALLNDVESYPAWVPRNGGITVLKRVSPEESYVHGKILTPWPFYDRDAVVHFKLNQDPDTLVVTIEMKGMSDFYSLQKGYVRVHRLSGFWKITPMANNVVEVTYRIHAEPGGVLPIWIVNRLTVGVISQTIINMREAVNKEAYQSATVPYITEPSK